MGSIDPSTEVVDESILDTLLVYIAGMVAPLPSNVTEIQFIVTMPTQIEASRGGFWAHDHNFAYKIRIEEMALDTRFGERNSYPCLMRINFVYLYQESVDRVNIRLTLRSS